MNEHATLLAFFKALADANRLRIVGLLARRPHTVEELAAILDLRASTVSHHLSRLAESNLVSAQVDGHHHVYSLDTAALEATARTLLAADTLPKVADDVDIDAYDRKVLETFLDADGRLTRMPMQRKKFEVILRHVLRAFEDDRKYSGREVDEILRGWSDDVATLRRGLIDHGLMAREVDGSRYWRRPLIPSPTEAGAT